MAEELLSREKDGLPIETMGEADAEFLSAVMDALQTKLQSAIAKQCVGGSGGKPDRAQAGGRNPEALEAALAGTKDLI